MNRLFSTARVMLCFIHNRNKERGAVKPLLFNLSYLQNTCLPIVVITGRERIQALLVFAGL